MQGYYWRLGMNCYHHVFVFFIMHAKLKTILIQFKYILPPTTDTEWWPDGPARQPPAGNLELMGPCYYGSVCHSYFV